MPRLRKALVLALAASLLLVGCGTSTAPLSLDGVAPATGPTVTGTGYSFNAPETWSVPDQGGMGAYESFATSPMTDEGFMSNVNVGLSPLGSASIDALEKAAVAELKNTKVPDFTISNVTVKERVMVAGSEAAHVSSDVTMREVAIATEQYFLKNDGRAFVVTFTYLASIPKAERDAISESILATWTWK